MSMGRNLSVWMEVIVPKDPANLILVPEERTTMRPGANHLTPVSHVPKVILIASCLRPLSQR